MQYMVLSVYQIYAIIFKFGDVAEWSKAPHC